MKAFFDAIRPMFGGKMTAAQVQGVEALLSATNGMQISHRAYLLATVLHETDRTMQPISEYGRGRGKKYGAVDQTGKAPYGRGYVQITWRENYLKADQKLGLGGKLAQNYDLALDPHLAAQILVQGCRDGWFTGKKLSDYLPGDYRNARRIVNGTDKADLIAGYATKFEAALGLLDAYSTHTRQPTAAPVSIDAPAFNKGVEAAFHPITTLLRAIAALLSRKA